jgi:CRP-like cAMP-binding protein
MSGSTAFLSRLSDADRAALGARWSVRNYGRDETIIAHDETGRDVFFVLEGRARATLFSIDGRAIAYRDIEPGDIFGELAAIDGRTRSATVVALEATRAARLTEAAFREIVTSRPAVTWALLEHLSAQMRRMTDRIYEYSTLVVRKRLIRELLRLSELAEPSGELVSISPSPTHFELAATISTHREAVSREMSALAKQKLIEKRGRRLLVLNVPALRRLAEDDDDC